MFGNTVKRVNGSGYDQLEDQDSKKAGSSGREKATTLPNRKTRVREVRADDNP